MGHAVLPAVALSTDRPFPQMAGRLEDARLLLGHGSYIDDLPISPRTLHASILRSPHAHAKIRNIDLDGARATDKVVAAYSGEDIASVLDPFPSIIARHPLIAPSRLEKFAMSESRSPSFSRAIVTQQRTDLQQSISTTSHCPQS